MTTNPPHGRGSATPGPVSGPKLPSNESKARGANRSSKTAGKLQVLPDSTADKNELELPSADVQLPKPPPAAVPVGPHVVGPSTAGSQSDEDEADDEEDEAEDEQDAEVSSTAGCYEQHSLIALFVSGLHSNSPDSGRYSEAGCTTFNEKESEILASSDSLCHRRVSEQLSL